MIIQLVLEFILEYVLFRFGQIFVFCVTLGRFPSSEQADEYDGVLKIVGLIVWVSILIGVSFWTFN